MPETPSSPDPDIPPRPKNLMAREFLEEGGGPSWRERSRFRLVHVLYATALLASALATFGPGGLVPGLVVLACWTVVFTSRSRPRTLAVLGLLFLVGLCMLGLLLPSFSPARQASQRIRCMNNLKSIGLALHNYYDTYGSFPPPYLPDKEGRPMHSWRVLILPYLDQQALYEAYDFDEPWDGPNNRKLAESMPVCYACPAHDPATLAPGHTCYHAVTGGETAWSEDQPRIFKDFPDGTSHTILVLEGSHDIPWMAPIDADLEKGIGLLSSAPRNAPHRIEDFFVVKRLSRNVCLADGSTDSLDMPLDRELAQALLIRNDRRIEAMVEASETRRTHLPKYDNWARLATFVMLVLLPLPWVWRRPPARSTRDAPAHSGRVTG
jgi:hypothetical protein